MNGTDLRAHVDDLNRFYWVALEGIMKSKYCVKYDTYVAQDYQDCESCTRCADGRG